jgi:hypothetical protein
VRGHVAPLRAWAPPGPDPVILAGLPELIDF